MIEEVARARRDGFVDGPTAAGQIWSIARPLPREGQALAMVLGLAGPTEQVRPNVDTLQAIMAEAIERWIGGSAAVERGK
jgi:hypothetical protein